MGSARRRAVLIAALALVTAAAAWIAVWVLQGTRIDWRDADGGPGVTVSAEMPAGTCRKELTASFPWVRFACDRSDDSSYGDEITEETTGGATDGASEEANGEARGGASDGAAPAAGSLDSAQDAE